MDAMSGTRSAFKDRGACASWVSADALFHFGLSLFNLIDRHTWETPSRPEARLHACHRRLVIG
jgi:hypothetical protein